MAMTANGTGYDVDSTVARAGGSRRACVRHRPVRPSVTLPIAGQSRRALGGRPGVSLPPSFSLALLLHSDARTVWITVAPRRKLATDSAPCAPAVYLLKNSTRPNASDDDVARLLCSRAVSRRLVLAAVPPVNNTGHLNVVDDERASRAVRRPPTKQLSSALLSLVVRSSISGRRVPSAETVDLSGRAAWRRSAFFVTVRRRQPSSVTLAPPPPPPPSDQNRPAPLKTPAHSLLFWTSRW
uniref:Uncharacterized protein n=1 Tax=Plectus sambesii TaxID=2011161 RepID=A0A914W1Z2_9BILA